MAIKARRNGKPICSGCGRKRPGYERLSPDVFSLCRCGGLQSSSCMPAAGGALSVLIKAERLPWASGKEEVTTTSQWFLMQWAKRLLWQKVAHIFHSSWNTV
jgi:hypothetical protein